MKFTVSEQVFEALPNVCFGIVVAKGIDNTKVYPEIEQRLQQSIAEVEAKFEDVRAKQSEEIAPYRDAFQTLGFNPNKFMSSIEAMASRIEKKKGFPSINPAVDLGNAISLKYLVPMGAHDMEQAGEDICVRFAKAGDTFVPFGLGQTEAESPDDGELVYAVGEQIKTRRWIWRQSELGKITSDSRHIFFPIDGFMGRNDAQVAGARAELAEWLQAQFGCAVLTGWVDRNNRKMEL
ncbi:phenylalanine--tRNA ligase beta subunit-related protein [Paenibacillus sp. MER TA 81-3]|uniref:B3/B4 domain-containing protein n=1 Tax=Paenibacillus sp. MER TA 81-3 TaxID=2939573 RepID=UPI00203F7597|nr:phenylalanine--tRNA ligase beta subunit-related protein [Paenibacillus sp. MER TA 81-3]MCM3341852.1 phenylalanine--tRNA ligase beta subunit-related protein [Paenibacillus sp. MER TA 81-3]